MEGLLLLLFFPIAWPFIAKRIWHTTINWQEMGLQIFIVVAATTLVWQLRTYGQTHDTEIWNGSVVSKKRDHGHYLSSYACNCRTVTSGSGSHQTTSTECDTCYEDHYTVTWSAETTVGSVRFAHRDSTSRSVYNLPDPEIYKRCVRGEPASIERGYINYVKAVPESLFNDKNSLAETFKDAIPKYPRVYDFYRIDRVIEMGTNLPKLVHTQINNGLSETLKNLGAEKQVNIIVIFTSITDPNYRYAVENAWLGGKKNDVVLFIGLLDTQIIWSDVMTWARNSGNELFHVKMRDGLKALRTVDAATMVPFISETVTKHYTRPKMKDFEYLKDAIEPPVWVIIIAVMLATLGSIGLTFVFHRVDINFLNR